MLLRLTILMVISALFMAACGDSAESDSQQAPPSSPATSAQTPPPAPTIKPPYPLTDSSQITYVDGVGIYYVEKGSGGHTSTR